MVMGLFKKKNTTQQLEIEFPPAPESEKLLNLEQLKCKGMGTRIRRAKVPGGWLVAIENMSGLGMTFYPDPNHEWDGKTLK